MFDYIMICNDKVVERGESKYYADVEGLVPDGYRYSWAFRSPGGMMINVGQDCELYRMEF